MKSTAASAAVPARVMPALLLLAAEGASVAFFLRALRGARWLPAFVARNELPPHGRDHLISWLVVGATVPCVVLFAAVAVAWRTGGRTAAAERTEQAGSAARLLAVCVVLWAVPPMLTVNAWTGRDLSFLLSAAVLVLALRNLRELARTIPPDASVAATEHDTPHLAQREYLFTLKYEHQGADYLLYSYDDLDFGAARRIVTDELQSGRFGFHAERPNFVVLRRGAPLDRNAELLQLLAGRQ